jgi:hypothetical protein
MWLLEQRTDGPRLRVGQGTWVKVGVVTGAGTERFWCKVVQVTSDGTRILATVALVLPRPRTAYVIKADTKPVP